jgi:predicted amidohydrolase
MQDLRVSTIQTSLFWEQCEKNLNHFDSLIDQIGEPSDLILLPEMFNTGFSINPGLCAESMDGPSVGFLRRKASSRNAVIIATLLIREGEAIYNRLVVMYPDGHFVTYDKRHLFRLSEELRIITRGAHKTLVEVNGWKILPMVCYDLRFPVWSKNNWKEGRYEYDLLVYLANWPGSRSQVWKTLLTARAIENHVYAAGVNRIGDDGNGTWHAGESMIADAKGNILYTACAGKQEVRTVILSWQELQLYRDAFTIGMDWDHFTIE